MTTYEYKRLESLKSIRLLKIHSPNKPNEPLSTASIEITHQLLEETPPYETLSYTWGNLNLTAKLQLPNSQHLLISESLSTALRYIIPSTSFGFLWIDQVCINQTDVDERSSQVSLMGEIYSRAERVLVWLGEDRSIEGISCGELVMELVGAIGSHPDGEHDCTGQIGKKLSEKLRTLIRLERPVGEVRISRGQLRRTAITTLLSCAWWKRAWVFQEIIFSKGIKVMLGKRCFEWRDIEYVVNAVCEIEYEGRGYRDSIAKNASGYDCCETMMHNHWELKVSNPIKALGVIVHVGGSFSATDIRDYVFAFAGFAAKAGVVFKPDYSQTAVQTFSKAARAFIETTGMLDVLGYVPGYSQNIGTMYRMEAGLPTWSPNWSVAVPVPMPIHDDISPSAFKACGSFKHVSVNGSDESVLLVRGQCIDSIRFMELIHQFERGYFMDDIRTFLNLETQLDTLNRHRYEWTNVITRERLLRAILSDGRIGHQKSVLRAENRYLTDEIVQDFLDAHDKYPQIIAGSLPEEELKEAKANLYKLQQLSLVTQHKRVVLSESGRLGLVPKASVRGDKICIFHGGRAPVVVREVRQGKFMPTGFCFLEGVMFGEAVDWKELEAPIFELV